MLITILMQVATGDPKFAPGSIRAFRPAFAHWAPDEIPAGTEQVTFPFDADFESKFDGDLTKWKVNDVNNPTSVVPT